MTGVVPEPIVNDRRLHMKECLRSGSAPSRLLLLAKALIDQLVHRQFDVCR